MGERTGLFTISVGRHEGEMRMRLTGLGIQNPLPRFLTPRRPVHVIFAVSLSLSLSSLGVSGWPDMQAAEPLRRLLVDPLGVLS